MISSRFKAATSIYSLDNLAVIDMTSFNDRTFNGSLQFTIDCGRGEILRVSDELGIGITLSADVASTAGFTAPSFEITRGVAAPDDEQ